MRIAFDITLPSRQLTGVGVYAQELLTALIRRPLEISPWRYCLERPGNPRDRLVNALRLLRWHHIQVPRLVQHQRIDVYHSACPVGPVHGGFARVMTVHDASAVTMPPSRTLADRLYQRIYSVLAARRATAVIVPSTAARDAIARVFHVRPERLHIVPYGVAPFFKPVGDPARSEVLRKWRLTTPYVLFVGAEPPRKNLPRLIRAFERAVQAAGDRETTLVFAGPSAPRDRCVDETIADLSLVGRFRRLGHVDAADLPAIYSGATCVAYPSLCEGFGFPVLEAMACGAPVLTSETTSTAEVAGDAALLVDPTDIDALSSALAQLLTDNTLREELRERGFPRALSYSWETSARLTEAVYRRAAAADA